MEVIADYVRSVNPIRAALMATVFTWFLTAMGASLIFVFKSMSRKVLDTMLGFTGGVMIAASFWSLLAPAIEMSQGLRVPSWFPAAAGFLAGSLFLFLLDKSLPHLHINFTQVEREGLKTNWNKTILLVLAITLHNIPEGGWRWGLPSVPSRQICRVRRLARPLRWPSVSACRIFLKALPLQFLFAETG